VGCVGLKASIAAKAEIMSQALIATLFWVERTNEFQLKIKPTKPNNTILGCTDPLILQVQL
jgi:hypothetical protein